MRGETARSLPAESPEEFWSFVLSTKRSIFDPWWLTASCDRAWCEWKAATA